MDSLKAWAELPMGGMGEEELIGEKRVTYR